MSDERDSTLSDGTAGYGVGPEAGGELKARRDSIDRIDDEILRLVSRRADEARAIGRLKGDGTVYRAEREAQVLRRLRDANPGPLPEAAVTRIFTEIMSACRALEDALTVAFLGPAGTFSEAAAIKHFGGSASKLACASVDDVFRRVESGAAGYGVVPVENSTEGAVGKTLDLLLHSPLKICGEVMLPVHQCFMTRAASPSAVARIYSHAQSLGQCHEWIRQNCPSAKRVAVISNAEAARLASEDPDSGAIASRNAAALYALTVFAESIEDEPNNTTRFLVVACHDAAPSGKDKTSLILSTQNRAGAFYELIAPFAKWGVSMSKLQSRPSRTGLWEYMFYVDVEGHQQDESLARALQELHERAAFVKVLGSYPTAGG